MATVDKKKLNRKDYIFQDKDGETLLKNPGQINGLDFCIMNLKNCKVYLMDHIAQIFVDDCTDSEVFIGPVTSTLFVRDCKNLKITGAAGQVRISDSSNIDACIYSNTEPALENCKAIRVAPYNFWYPKQNEHFSAANLDPTVDRWSHVFDFNHNATEPNWSLLPASEYAGPHKQEVEGEGEPENPVQIPQQYGGTLQGEIVIGSAEQNQSGGKADGGLVAFDIHTSQKDALQALDEQEPQEEEQHQPEYNQFENQAPQDAQQQGGNDFDDYFGGQSNAQNTTQQSTGFEAFNASHHNASYDQGFGQQNQNASYDQGFGQQNQNASYDQGFGQPSQAFSQPNQSFHESADPEEDERLFKLRKQEEERSRRLQEKINEERLKKDERRMNASQELNQWASDRSNTVKKRRELNLQNQKDQQEAKAQKQEYKNPWEKVVGNVALKAADYPGSKDISRFRQALINKRADMA